jgi:Sec-independent protein translocase protein TatA
MNSGQERGLRGALGRAMERGKEVAMMAKQELTEGQRAYEAKRAAKESAAAAKAAEPAKKNWLSRMLDKAHQPLK